MPLPAPSRHSRGSRRHRRARVGALDLGMALALGGSLAGCQGQPAAEIGVYFGRHSNTDKEPSRAFTARTGIHVRLLEGTDSALIERVRTESPQTQADVLVRVDAARLERAARLGLLQPVRSVALERDVPAALGDPEGRWFALTRRVRLLVLDPSLREGLAGGHDDLARPELGSDGVGAAQVGERNAASVALMQANGWR